MLPRPPLQFRHVALIGKYQTSHLAAAVAASRAALDAIATTANTGKIGDGKIFVTNLEQAVRIRTGETGSDAL